MEESAVIKKKRIVMKYGVSKTGIKINVVYALLVLVAFVFLFSTIDKNSFAYLYLIFLSIPWSLVFAVIALLQEGVGEMSTLCKTILFGVFIIINFLIINWLGLKYDSRNDVNKEIGE